MGKPEPASAVYEVTDEAVREAVRETLEARDGAMDANRKAISKAIRVGRMLVTKKEEIGHGKFQDWIESLELDVEYRMCCYWMKLHLKAKESRVAKRMIDEAQSLREALTLTGILPESEGGSGSSTGASGNAFLTFLTRGITHIQARINQRPLSEWPQEEKRELKEKLDWLAELRLQLAD